jgi:hypothetical protein
MRKTVVLGVQSLKFACMRQKRFFKRGCCKMQGISQQPLFDGKNFTNFSMRF